MTIKYLSSTSLLNDTDPMPLVLKRWYPKPVEKKEEEKEKEIEDLTWVLGHTPTSDLTRGGLREAHAYERALGRQLAEEQVISRIDRVMQKMTQARALLGDEHIERIYNQYVPMGYILAAVGPAKLKMFENALDFAMLANKPAKKAELVEATELQTVLLLFAQVAGMLTTCEATELFYAARESTGVFSVHEMSPKSLRKLKEALLAKLADREPAKAAATVAVHRTFEEVQAIATRVRTIKGQNCVTNMVKYYTGEMMLAAVNPADLTVLYNAFLAKLEENKRAAT